MHRSIVVTGGGRGVGRGICQRLLQDSDHHVVVLEQDPAAVEWMSDHPDGDRLHVVSGDASDPAAADAAAEMAEAGDSPQLALEIRAVPERPDRGSAAVVMQRCGPCWVPYATDFADRGA